MQKICLYYWLFEPLHEDFLDTSDSVPVFKVPVRDRDSSTEHQLAVFADLEGRLNYARLKLNGLEEEKIPEGLQPMVHAVKEHLLTTLIAS